MSLSIQSCLSGFLAEEKDTEETAHLCRKCECDQIHTQGKKITRIGAALVIYLQRYNSPNPGLSVAVPLELDLSEWVSGSGKYSLCSVIHHSGGMEGGHYTCYAKARSGWMFFNDRSAQFREFDQDFCNASTLFIYAKEEYT
jgi:ubiquitin C-terminal hydrolase